MGVSLFNLLDDGDGAVTQEEFLNGVMRLKGHARSLDIILITKDLQTVIQQLNVHGRQLKKIEKVNSKLLNCGPLRHDKGNIAPKENGIGDGHVLKELTLDQSQKLDLANGNEPDGPFFLI